MTIALDISHFTKETSGDLTKKQLDDAWDSGVRVFRPNIGNQDVAVSQIDAIVDSGHPFKIWTYNYYYFGRSLAQANEDKAFIQRVRDLKYDIQLHSLDIEDTNPNFNPTMRINEVAQLIPQFENFCATDYYTAEWYHASYMNNTTQFSYMPLWYARYGHTNNDLTNPPNLNVAFGGWTKAHMHQYAGDVYWAGIWCDVNYYIDTDPEPNPPNPNPDPNINELIIKPGELYRFLIETK